MIMAAERPAGFFVLGMPRSGTSFVARALTRLLDCELVRITHALTEPSITDGHSSWHSPQLSVEKLKQQVTRTTPFVAHFHPSATPALAYHANRENVAVVFNRRNLVDCLLSWHHVMVKQAHARKEEIDAIGQALWAPLQISSCALQRYLGVSADQQLAFLIENVAPWYIQYVANWENSFRKFNRLLVIDYAALKRDNVALLHNVNERFSLGISSKAICEYSRANPRKECSVPSGLVMGKLEMEKLYAMAARIHGTDFASRLLID